MGNSCPEAERVAVNLTIDLDLLCKILKVSFFN